MCFVYSLPGIFAHFFEMLKSYAITQGCIVDLLLSNLLSILRYSNKIWPQMCIVYSLFDRFAHFFEILESFMITWV